VGKFPLHQVTGVHHQHNCKDVNPNPGPVCVSPRAALSFEIVCLITNLVITTGPVIASSTTMVCNKHILVIVQVAVLAVLNAVDDTRLQVNKQCSWNIVFIICLVKEDILAISSLLARNPLIFQTSKY
jgi:hypothetical protein